MKQLKVLRAYLIFFLISKLINMTVCYTFRNKTVIHFLIYIYIYIYIKPYLFHQHVIDSSRNEIKFLLNKVLS